MCLHRFVLKGVNYNPLDVMNVLMLRRGYKVEGDPQQRTLPSIHHKDDKSVEYKVSLTFLIFTLKLHPGERA